MPTNQSAHQSTSRSAINPAARPARSPRAGLGRPALGAALAIAACAGFATATDSFPSPLVPVNGDLDAAFQQLAVDAVLAGQLGDHDSFTLERFFIAPGKTVSLNLERATSFADDATLRIEDENGERILPLPEYDLFRGTVEGHDDSIAVFTMSDSMIAAMVLIDGDTYILSSGPADQGLDPVAFQLNTLPDGLIPFVPFKCDADLLGAAHDGPVAGGSPFDPHTESDNPCRVIETAIETDSEYLDLFGSNATAATQYTDLLVTANTEFYSRDLNVAWEVQHLKLWSGADPWSQGSTVDQLFQFRDYWIANNPGVARDNAHFFSGRNLGGGVAWLDAICSEFSYALSANLNGFFPYPTLDRSDQNWDIIVTGHEWGHNIGTPHTHDYSPQIDGCGTGDCTLAPQGTIMSYCHTCPGGLSNMRIGFASRVIDHISNDLNDYACVDTVPCDDCPADLTGSSDPNDPSYGQPDGDADGDDFFFYLDAFGNNNLAVCDLTGSSDPNDPTYGNPDADCDGDDFFFYLDLFSTGCP